MKLHIPILSLGMQGVIGAASNFITTESIRPNAFQYLMLLHKLASMAQMMAGMLAN
jgi:hypothetical protein